MEPDTLIEVSYEVANKVGGIYQVLKSKAGEMVELYGDNYLTIGFYDEDKARTDFKPRSSHSFGSIFESLKEDGIDCHYGVWDIPHSPRCILIDVSDIEKDVDELKTELWEQYGIDSLDSGPEFGDPLKWAYAVGRLIDALKDQLPGETVVQLHEWLSGPAMFYSSCPTVFTTHATVLGRALSNAGKDVVSMVQQDVADEELAEDTTHKYTRLCSVDGDHDRELASEFGVKARHLTEKAAAQHAEVFTTVSEVTAQEATCILKREPDVVLPNGFNVEEFPSLEELSYQHKKKKAQMKQFLQAYFEPYYNVDDENDPRILFISGRYEFHNKGIDVFIDALSRVNEREGDELFVFIFVPSDVKREKTEVLENLSLYDELEHYVESLMPELRHSMLQSITSGSDDIMDGVKQVLGDMKSLQTLKDNFHAKRGGKPPLCAFDLTYPNDQILDSLYQHGLRNEEDDRVKVVFYPTYLKLGDRMLSMSYNDAIIGSSAGIFPSYYEPWGYTPVETAANGALSVTTDLAGFGQFLLENTEEGDRKGIQVLKRRNQSDDDAASDLADMIHDITTYSKTEITERKHNARKLVQLTSWKRLIQNYREAHSMALQDRS